MQPILIIDYNELGNQAFAAKYTHIAQCAQNNPNYPLPWASGVPTPPLLLSTASSLSISVSDAESGDRTKIAHRNDLRDTGEGHLKVLGHYYMATTPGNITAFESSGFDLRNSAVRPIALVPPAAPSGLRVKRGVASGTACVAARSDPRATHYQLQNTMADPTVEANFGSTIEVPTCGRIALANLVPLKTYVFRLRAFNRAGWGPWAVSAPIVIL